MAALVAELDLRQPLHRLTEAGATFVPRALTEPFRDLLMHEVNAGPFDRLPEQVGRYGVRQQAEHRVILGDDVGGYPGVDQLRREFVARLRAHADDIQGLGEWYPNDTSIQRYQVGSLGISPHLDNKRYRYLVAIFTLEGAAPLALCTGRQGAVQQEWETVPGSLVLLRGPGLGGAADGRPLHTVAGPTGGRRTSLTFRLDSRLSPSTGASRRTCRKPTS